MTLTTIETRIKAEWNTVEAFVALHPYITMLICLVAGFIIGHFG